MVIRGIFFAMLLAGMGAAQAQAPAPQGGLPPGSQPALGNWVVAYIEVVPGSEAKALAALRALKTASAKDNGYLMRDLIHLVVTNRLFRNR